MRVFYDVIPSRTVTAFDAVKTPLAHIWVPGEGWRKGSKEGGSPIFVDGERFPSFYIPCFEMRPGDMLLWLKEHGGRFKGKGGHFVVVMKVPGDGLCYLTGGERNKHERIPQFVYVGIYHDRTRFRWKGKEFPFESPSGTRQERVQEILGMPLAVNFR